MQIIRGAQNVDSERNMEYVFKHSMPDSIRIKKYVHAHQFPD